MQHKVPEIIAYQAPGPAHRPEILPGGTIVWTDSVHRIGTDSLLLADFCEAHRGWSACDLGSGCGVLILSLWDKGVRGALAGVELDATAAELLAGGAHASGAEISSYHGDLRHYRPNRLCDLVVANPPYFTTGLLPPVEQRANARHQLTSSIHDFCHTAARIIKTRGRFCVCYPASQLAELMQALQANRLQPKRMRLARKSPNAAPWLVLMDARKDGGCGLHIMPDLILPPGQAVQY